MCLDCILPYILYNILPDSYDLARKIANHRHFVHRPESHYNDSGFIWYPTDASSSAQESLRTISHALLTPVIGILFQWLR